MEFLQNISFWYWLILGVALLAAESLGAGGFLIGASLAAFVLGLLKSLFPEMSWQLQFFLFAALSVVATWVYWKRFRHYNQKTDSPQLNHRAAQLIGRTAELQEPIIDGQGRIQLGDTYWKIRSEQDALVGRRVKVIGAEEMVLLVDVV